MWGGLAWTYSRREPTDQRIYSTVRQKTSSREASGPSLYPSVRLTDRPPYYHNCTPRDCSERLPFFGEPHLFFKWPYLSLKKMRHLGTMGAGKFSSFRFIFFFSLSFGFCVHRCRNLLSSRHHFLLSLRTLGICRLVLLAGGVSIMSKASVP